MSSSTDENQAYVNFYLRRKWFKHVVSYCDSQLKSSLADPYLILWKCFALAQSGNATTAVQELAQLEEKRDFIIVWHLAMIFSHQKCKYVDNEAVAQLQAKFTIAMASANISEKGYSLAGLFSWHIGDIDESSNYYKSALSKNANCIGALVGLGWLEFEAKGTTTYFDKALEKSMRDIEAMFGQSALFRKQRKIGASLEISNRIIAYYPNFLPALIERLYMLVEMLSWDAILESAQRLGGVSHDNIDSLLIISWYETCLEGPSQTAITYIKTLRKAIERLEPNNPDIFYTTARLFSRLANRNPMFLEECEIMLKIAIKLSPNESKYYNELGYVHFLIGDLQHSKESYEKASQLDPHNIQALEGIIRWLIYTEQYDTAQSQLEMFVEIQRAVGASANISHLNSILALKKRKDSDGWLTNLKEALQIQLKSIQGIPITPNYYILFDPEFILSIIRNYIESDIWQQLPPDESDSFQRIIRDILEILLRIVPGSTEALYFIGRVQLLLGDAVGAEVHLLKAIQKNKTDLKAYLLLSEIHVGNKNFKSALSALEMALSFDFTIRQDVSFLLLKAKCLNGQELFTEGLAVMKTAFNLVSVKEAIVSLEKGANTKTNPSKAQVALLFLGLLEAQIALNNRDDLVLTMNHALKLFKGSIQESMFVLMNAKEALRLGDVKLALDTLSSIQPDQITYLEARSLMADIYLTKKHDRKRYAICFKEVVEKRPTVDSCIMLGNAFLKIQEPLEAISVYQAALNSYPEKTIFVGKIGNAYVMMHDYAKAISYYNAAILNSSSDKLELQYELARLLLKLKRYEEASRIAQEGIDGIIEHDYPTFMEAKIKRIQGDIFAGLQQGTLASTCYLNSKETLMRILSKESGKQANQIRIEIANVCVDLGKLCESLLHENERAVAHYSEAIQFYPEHKKASIYIAKLQIKQGNHSAAQNQLSGILEKDENSVEATLMMADLMCEKSSFQSAFYHYRKILDNNPANFELLADFINIANRLNKLEEVPAYFDNSKNHSTKSKINLGFHYCKGLYFRYTHSINEALKEFILCRKDNTWGEKSLLNLIDIFLNPSDETLGGEALVTAIDSNESPNDLNADMDLTSVITADKLITELPQDPKSPRTQILEFRAMMASKQKDDIDLAVSRMMDILKTEPDYIPAIYGTSVGFMLLKQSPRARNQLKRVSKMEWSKEYGDDIEKCWILLADIYIQGGKYDLATELLKKVTAVNQSSSKSWEYLGFIMEKEQSYQDASEYYFKCWKLKRQSDPVIGFKLAFNYLKAKRYTDAIDISHMVLKAEPNYPKIKTDILNKAREQLKKN